MEDTGKQAKKKALQLLERMDRTESGLRQKLKEKGFSAEDIEGAIQYVTSFGYLNDRRYAEQFVLGRQERKSRKELRMAMYQKGLSSDVIDEALENCYEAESEVDTIRRLAEKKGLGREDLTDKEKKKIFDYLLRKGFSYENVRHVIQVSSWNA